MVAITHTFLKGCWERLEFFREFSSLLGIFLGERFVAVTLGARTEFYLRLYEKFDGQSKFEAHGTNVVPETRYSCIWPGSAKTIKYIDAEKLHATSVRSQYLSW